jgi:undecaprenyl-diphosphatase
VDRRTSLARDPWAVAGVACALGFVAVAAIVNGQGTVFVDAPVIETVRGLPVPVDAWRAVTQAGGWLLVVVGAALVLALVAAGRARMALVVAIALVAAALATDAMKDLVARPRPPDPVADAGGYSFPSGHTLNSTVTYGIAALEVWRSSLPGRVRVAATAGLVVLIALVGLSRIALGVHYPSDVIAGWLAGTVVVSIVAVLDRADRASRMGVTGSAVAGASGQPPPG